MSRCRPASCWLKAVAAVLVPAVLVPAVLVPAVLVPAVLVLAVPVAAEQVGKDLEVQVEPFDSSSSVHGYAEYKVQLWNRSPDRQHLVSLSVPAISGLGSGGGVSAVRRQVLVPPAARIRVSLLQPPLPVRGSDLLVTVDGGAAVGQLSLATDTGHRSYYPAPPSLVLISPAISLASIPEPGSETVQHLPLRRLEDWPTSWLAAARYDLMLISNAELQALTAEQRAVLLSFARCGGVLLVVGSSPWPFAGEIAASGDPAADLVRCQVGFGLVLITRQPSASLIDAAVWAKVDAAREASQAPWTEDPSPSTVNQELPVVLGFGVPVRGLFVLMITFAVLIGPINILLLRRRRRQIWLLVTAPVISACTAITILVWSLLAEGVTTRVRSSGLSLLDQAGGRAVTIGRLAYYAPLTAGDGLHLPADAELTPLIASYSSGSSGSVDWSNGQHLYGGWIRSRVPAHFMWRRQSYQRQRLQVHHRADGRLEVVNGLGAPIKSLWLNDRQGARYRVNELAAGAAALLEPAPEQAGRGGEDLRSMFQTSHWAGLPEKAVALANQLPAGSYLALLPVNPFLEPGLADYQLLESSDGAVLGLLAPEPAASKEDDHAG